MSEPTATPALIDPVTPARFPELSTEQRLAVREAQFQVFAIREQATNAVNQVEQNLANTVRKIAADLKIPDGAQFNYGPLTFSNKQ